MVTSLSVPRSDPRIRRIIAATFPNYRGRKIRVSPWSGPVYVDWNWSGGTKDTVRVIAPAIGKVAAAVVPAPWSHDHSPVHPADFGPGAILVVHSIFCGVDAGLSIYVAPSDPLLGGGAK